MINEGNILTGYTYELAANQRVKVNTVGDTIACYAAAADFEIEVGSNKAPMAQGMVFRSNYFTQGVSIINGATAQTITIYIGDGDIDLPIPSTVEVIDKGIRRTKLGESFIATSRGSAVAAAYLHHQLYNGSTDRVAVIRQLTVVANSASSDFAFYKSSAEITTGTNITSYTPISKNMGGADDTSGIIAKSANMTGATHSTAIASGEYLVFPVAGGTHERLPMSDPIRVEPGETISVFNGVVNQASRLILDYYTEAV